MASKSSSKKRPCLSCGKLCTARCAQCKAVNFCSRACQVKCWPEHRATCKPNKAKAAASTSTASTPTVKRLASSTSSSAPAPPGPSLETARRLRILNRMRRAVDDHMRGAGMSTRDSPNRLFQMLLKRATFEELVYKGQELPASSKAPRTLQALLSAREYEPALLEAIPLAEARAKSVLDGVKRKASAAGDTMDPTTEAMLQPQILQEAFAREVVAMMTRLARDAAAAQAASEEALASPTSAIAVWDQIPGQLLTKLVRQGYTLVDDFLGSDWVPLVRADLLRLHKQGKLKPATGSVNDFLRRAGHGPATATAQAAAAATAAAKGPANANNSNSDSSRTATAVPLTCAVDLSHTADFPALGELLERLLALPFELNRKARLKLGVPLQGSLHVTCLPAGASRPVRRDNPGGAEENGVKLSANYFVPPPQWKRAVHGGALQLLPDNKAGSAATPVEPKLDRLVLLSSRQVANGMEAVTAGHPAPLFYVSLYLHGPPK